MSYSAYNLPVFSSSERLSALARFVSESDNNSLVSTATTTVLQPTNVNKVVNNQPSFLQHDVARFVPNAAHPLVNAQDIHTEEIVVGNQPDVHANTYNDVSNIKNNLSNLPNGKTEMFTVTSAGFTSGNFSEFRLGQRIFIPKESSKRGITVLYLTNNNKTFHAWNFDFYHKPTKLATNRNFISLLRRLPGNTYFAMSVKDDAWKNLFEGTKNFLARIIGCKTIWRLNYRHSWSAIVYKKTEKSFEVVSEAHNIAGTAVSQYPLINTENNISHSYASHQPVQHQTTFSNELNNSNNSNNPNNLNNLNNSKSMNIVETLNNQPVIYNTNQNQFEQDNYEHTDYIENNDNENNEIDNEIEDTNFKQNNTNNTDNTELINITTKLSQDIQELKKIVLIQSALIKQLIANKK